MLVIQQLDAEVESHTSAHITGFECDIIGKLAESAET